MPIKIYLYRVSITEMQLIFLNKSLSMILKRKFRFLNHLTSEKHIVLDLVKTSM